MRAWILLWVCVCGQSGMTFKPVTLLFRDMWYTVDVPSSTRRGQCERVELLKGVSGYAKPGTLTALMGSSGRRALSRCI